MLVPFSINFEVFCKTDVSQQQRGYEFVSETDTEVIAKLAKFVFDELHRYLSRRPTFAEVCIEVVRHLVRLPVLTLAPWNLTVGYRLVTDRRERSPVW